MTLNAFPNVLITGHHAFLTDEALSNIADTTIYNLDCWDSGEESDNELTDLN
jgi:D-lactate dehydrogenase